MLAGLLLLVVPVGSADAAEPLPAPYGFQLPATHGYTVSVMAGQSPKSTIGTVLLFVRSPHAEVIYGARASLSETSIDADLGSVGGVHVDLCPQGKPAPKGRLAVDAPSLSTRATMSAPSTSWVRRPTAKRTPSLRGVS